jgi:hypothetical protein
VIIHRHLSPCVRVEIPTLQSCAVSVLPPCLPTQRCCYSWGRQKGHQSSSSPAAGNCPGFIRVLCPHKESFHASSYSRMTGKITRLFLRKKCLWMTRAIYISYSISLYTTNRTHISPQFYCVTLNFIILFYLSHFIKRVFKS